MSDTARRLARRIARDGALPFARFMEEALYGAGGYYARPRLPIGAGGDYVTGSSLSPLFGRATARLLTRLDRELGTPAALVEAGCAGGAHLGAVAAALEQTPGGVPAPRRRLAGWDRVARPLPAGVERLDDLDRLPERSVDGLVFSYELFDALPVHRLVGRDDPASGEGPQELWVTLDEEGRFAWRRGELSDPALGSLPGARSLAPGQVADLAPGWEPLYRRLARRLGRGLLVTCDYGFERQALLDARVRRHGTLACYRRQRVHRDPFVAVGEQDLTAHVDFTTLREAGEDEGLATVALTRQALWLTACGLFDELQEADAATRRQATTLLDGAGMGSEIRVLVQARDLEADRLLDPELLG